MAYQVGSACYDLAASAASASATSSIGAVVNLGGSPYVVDVLATSGTSITYQFNPVGGGSPVVSVMPYSAQPCQLLSAADGAVMGWGVAAAFVGVFCVMFLVRALRGETGGSYGNA